MRRFTTHGDGTFIVQQFLQLGENVIFESGAMVWHPETISIGNNVYVGHRAMLKGHPAGKLTIDGDSWIGQNVFLHSAGNITIGKQVGIGPGVQIITSYHEDLGPTSVLLDAPLVYRSVIIEDEVDVGLGSIVLPGVTIGQGSQIGAGSVVTRNVEPFSVMVGNPAVKLRSR